MLQEVQKHDGIMISDQFMNLHIILRGPDGKIKKEEHLTNQIQTALLTHVADALSDQGEVQCSHMAVGAGTGQNAAANVLASALGARQALDNSTPSHSGAVLTWHRTFAAGEGTGTITEAGVFNHLSAGTMFVYNDGLSYSKGAGDSLELTWTLTIN